MKFCVMKATEGDAVVYVEAEFREESHRQDVVGLQVILRSQPVDATRYRVLSVVQDRRYGCGWYEAYVVDGGAQGGGLAAVEGRGVRR